MDYRALASEFMKNMESMRKLRQASPQRQVDESMQGERFVLQFIAAHNGSIQPGEVSDEMGISSARIAAILNGLERKGLITRQIDRSDRRRILVDLTPAGKTLVKEQYQERIEMVTKMLSRLGEHDAREYVRIIGRLAEVVPEKVMSEESQSLTNMNPVIEKVQNEIRERFAQQNQTAKKGQIVFVGSSLMEIFPIEKMQQGLDLDKIIYNRGVRATTTADLLRHMDLCIFDLAPSKIFINIGTNDIGFGVPEATFLAHYDEILRQIKEKLPDTQVFVMAYYPINPVADFGESEAEHESLFATRTNKTLKAASSKVAQLAKRYHYEFINVNDGLSDADGNLRPELTFDGAHMLPAGYKIVLENMKKYL